MKATNVDKILKNELKNIDFKKEYDLIEGEFELAKEIIKLRLEANLTQKQLANMASTSQPAIARLESGNYKNVSLSFLRKIGKALGAVPEVHLKRLIQT